MNPKAKTWLKRLLIVCGVIFGLFALTAIIVPLVVNVDDYRPKILAAANESINGKLELGKMTLSMWGRIKVGVDGITLTDSAGRKVVDAKDVYLHVPWLSLLTLSPQVNFTMDSPYLGVVKDKNGLNVMNLMKKDPTATVATDPSAPASATTAPTTASKPMEIPGIVSRARLGVNWTRATLVYKDAKADTTAQIKDLNVRMKDASLSHPTEIDVDAMLDTKVGKTMTARGPLSFTAKGTPDSSGKGPGLRLSFKADADALELTMPELLEKKKGVNANATGVLKVSQESVAIEDLVVKFLSAEVKLSGGMSGLQSESPVTDVKFASNAIALKDWSQIVPMLKAYELGGVAKLEGEAKMVGESTTYRAIARLEKFSAKAPNLKAQPVIDAQINIVTDQVESMSLVMTAPQNHLAVTGKVVSFTKPRVDINVLSKGMDLDALVEFPKSKTTYKSGGAPAPSAPAPEATANKDAKETDFDKMVDPLRAIEAFRSMVATVKVKMDFLKVYNAKMTNIQSTMSFKGLTASVDSFSMGLWNGTVKATSAVQLAPKTPTYSLSAEAAKVDLNQAVSSQMELFKNTAKGFATFKMSGTGASFNPDPAKRNLDVKGNLLIEKATFATIDVGKMATEAINNSLKDVITKVPGMAGKGIKAPNNVDSKYDTITADFAIKGGNFAAPNFFAKAVVNQGLDVRGETVVGILDYGLHAIWEITDTYNVLGLKNVTVDIAGTPVPAILAENGQVVKFPIRVNGTIFSPQVNYTTAPEALAKVALNNIAKAAENRVKAEVQKKAQEAARSVINDLGKKLFGN